MANSNPWQGRAALQAKFATPAERSAFYKALAAKSAAKRSEYSRLRLIEVYREKVGEAFDRVDHRAFARAKQKMDRLQAELRESADRAGAQ